MIPDSFLVVDIGTYALKVAICTKKKKEFVITDARIIPYEEKLEEANFQKQIESTLTKLSNYENFVKKFATYITVSNHFVDYKTIKYNGGEISQEKNKIEEQIKLIYPIMGKKYLSNYHLFPRADTKNILSYHIKNTFLEDIYLIFKKHNFFVNHIEFSSISLYNLYLNLFSRSQNYLSLEPKMDMIVSLGESEVELIFIRSDFVSFEKVIGFSFTNLTQNIKDNINIKNNIKVQERKQSCNNNIHEGQELDQDRYISQALKKSIEELKICFTEQVNIFLSQNNITSINNIYLTGGHSYLSGIEKIFDEVNVKNIAILNSVKYNKNICIAPYLQEYDFLICMPSLQEIFGLISQFSGFKKSVNLNMLSTKLIKPKFKNIRNIAVLVGLLFLLFINFPHKELSISFEDVEQGIENIYQINKAIKKEYNEKIKLDNSFQKSIISINNKNLYIDFLKKNLKEENHFFIETIEKKGDKEKISGFLFIKSPDVNVEKVLQKKYAQENYTISFTLGNIIKNLYQFEVISKE